MAPTGIVMLNLGGPATLDAVEPFLLRLFEDREIIQLPFQRFLGPFIAKRRAPKVRGLYEAIGGGSPIRRWTESQGRGMVERLDRLSPATAPHRFYIAFRYTTPFSEDALRAMRADGVERAVAFTQYPQWSCTTTGSSLNELWRASARLGLENAFRWSIIDRWPVHEGFIAAMAETVREGLARFAEEDRGKVLILFSAHSLPMSVIHRGDSYPQEVGASVQRVMEALGFSHPFVLAYQSEVGPVKWLGPSTERTIELLAARGHRHVLVVPIAFTSDHIETLSELDREYGHLARECGITHFHRAPALNDRPRFLDAMADLVREHLASGRPYGSQYATTCAGCTNPQCRKVLRPIG
ncbi:MAG TPA: ferrochelatase [Gemmatimonadales bacterium]|nr:ferrochelatase [Gemmatimonadales bacterium]